jgi:uncharacterized protein (DUF302 family)
MKKVKLFEEFVSEVSKQMISGTSGRTITTLDNRKYELKKDIKDAKIGDYINVVLPKGTIIHNLPGGVFANHKDLKDKYCTGYKSERWDDKFGVGIRSMPDTLEAIEDNSKVLESIGIEEILNELHLSSAGVKDFLRAVYNSNTSILQKLNFKNFRGLTDYIKGSDIEEFDELRDEAKAAGLILAESTLNEAKKQKFVLYTNPNNSTDRGYVVIGAAEVREVLSDAKKYSDSYKILYQGTGTQADLVKAKQMFGDYRFGEESIDEAVELVHVYDTKGELQGTGELVKTKANKSLIRWDGSSEEWIDSKLVKLVESTINEDAATTFLILMQSAMVMGQLALLGNKISAGGGTTPIEDLKNWWQKRKSDKAVKSIIDKIKDDKDIVEFMKLTPSQQRGKFRSLIATKLNDEELNYLNKINRNHFQTESLQEGTYNNDREIAIYDGEDGLTYIEKRGKGYYGHNDEFDFEAEDKAELEKKLKSWKYKLISGSIDEAFIGPFFFSNSTSDEDLKKMYDDALSGYANWLKGFEYPKADYKKAYQEIEKLLKKRGIKVDESIVNEHSLQESKHLNEAKILSRVEMKNVMVTKYGLSFVKNSEEFDGEEGGIWLGGNDGLLMPNAKDDMFNYYHGGSKFPQGIHKDLAKFLDKCGWYGQFADPGTVMLWPR